MNILLINPPAENTVQEFPDENGQGFLEADDYGAFPPLGALYVLTYAKKKWPNHDYYFIDCVGEKIDYGSLSKKIKHIEPDLVGVTSFTISLLDVVKTAEAVRESFPNAHICLGGHHATAFPFEATCLPQFDSVIVGEGEYAFAELIGCLESKKDFTKILGLYTKDSILKLTGQTFKDSRFLSHVPVPPAYVEEIDDIPAPDRGYIKHINYNSIIGVSGKLATIITSRGCPYKCTFCDVPYKKYRQRSIELVMDEIEICQALGYNEFHFYDDLFNITAQKITEFCEALINRNLNIVWDFRGRVNAVTYESLEIAKRTGLRMISFGVETGTDSGLKALKKGTKIEQVERVFAWCRELGIKTVANYMIGLPHEKSEQDVLDNIGFLIRLDPDYAQVGILNLYPHTQVYNDAIKKGMIAEEKWIDFSLNPKPGFKVDHWTEFLTERQLVKLHRLAYHKFYFRVSYISRSLINIRSGYEFKAKWKGAIKLLSAYV